MFHGKRISANVPQQTIPISQKPVITMPPPPMQSKMDLDDQDEDESDEDENQDREEWKQDYHNPDDENVKDYE
jgi:hypothetical protein